MNKWAKKYKALIIVDEIQSGFGRTGKLFAYQHYGIKPDLVICGKAISGNLPLSAVLGSKKLIEIDPTLTSTHGGHPLSCAAASGNLDELVKKKLINRSNLSPRIAINLSYTYLLPILKEICFLALK